VLDATLALVAIDAGTVAVVVTVHELAVWFEQLTCAGSVNDAPLTVAELPCVLTVVEPAPFGGAELALPLLPGPELPEPLSPVEAAPI